METFQFQFTPLEALDKDFIQVAKNLSDVMLSYTEVGELLKKKPSVVAQYAKAGIIHPIQQGPKKVITMKEVYLLEACMYAVEHYGCSYTACKIIGSLLKNTDVDPILYKDYLQKLEKENSITKEETSKYVNSYRCRGIFQKQKNQKSKENI